MSVFVQRTAEVLFPPPAAVTRPLDSAYVSRYFLRDLNRLLRPYRDARSLLRTSHNRLTLDRLQRMQGHLRTLRAAADDIGRYSAALDSQLESIRSTITPVVTTDPVADPNLPARESFVSRWNNYYEEHPHVERPSRALRLPIRIPAFRMQEGRAGINYPQSVGTISTIRGEFNLDVEFLWEGVAASHPHISGTGVCLGDARPGLLSLLKYEEPSVLIEEITRILTLYNPANCYHQLGSCRGLRLCDYCSELISCPDDPGGILPVGLRRSYAAELPWNRGANNIACENCAKTRVCRECGEQSTERPSNRAPVGYTTNEHGDRVEEQLCAAHWDDEPVATCVCRNCNIPLHPETAMWAAYAGTNRYQLICPECVQKDYYRSRSVGARPEFNRPLSEVGLTPDLPPELASSGWELDLPLRLVR